MLHWTGGARGPCYIRRIQGMWSSIPYGTLDVSKRNGQRGGGAHPRTVDFSGIQLNVGVASVLSDVFTIEWGLRKLVFKECDLDEHVS